MFYAILPPSGIFTPHGTLSPEQLIPSLIVLVVGLAFWGWMFRDMIGNTELSPSAKQGWAFAFILLNVFAAVFYYATEYRNRHKRP
jgi:cytochrome c oxidase assembly factor CtaG